VRPVNQPRLLSFDMKVLEVRILSLSVLSIETGQYSYQGYSFPCDVTPCSLVYDTVVSGEFTASIFTVGETKWRQYFPQNVSCPSSKIYDTRPQNATNQFTYCLESKMFTFAGTVVCQVVRPCQCCRNRVKGGDATGTWTSSSHPPPPLSVVWIILIQWSNTATALCVSCQDYYIIWFVSVGVDFFKPEVRIVYNKIDPRSKGHFTIQGKQLRSCDFGLGKYEVKKCLKNR